MSIPGWALFLVFFVIISFVILLIVLLLTKYEQEAVDTNVGIVANSHETKESEEKQATIEFLYTKADVMKADGHQIVYSILFHESEDCVIDFFNNLFYYNAQNDFVCIVHTTPDLQPLLESKLKSPRILFYPEPFRKRKYSSDILRAHMQNMQYCFQQGISFSYFIPLASNCLFRAPVTFTSIRALFSANVSLSPDSKPDKTQWHWPDIIKNVDCIDFLQKHGITELYHGQHEGMIMDEKTALLSNQIWTEMQYKITNESIFEEFFWHTMFAFCKQKDPSYICHVFFWDGQIPSQELVTACKLPCFKAVPREYNHKLRSWIRQKSLYYIPPYTPLKKTLV